ncbi:transmembrane protease serine 11G-like [Oculina patagonica]
MIVHESYNRDTYSHDIALLKLKTKATLGAGVGLVCLPDDNFPLEPNKKCYITGWGNINSNDTDTRPAILQEASVPIVSQQQCNAWNWLAGRIDDSMICAGFEEGGVDACQGDSGGPLVCEFNGKWYLEGVVSWGYRCALARSPGVYANVRYLQKWVEDKMKDN